MAAQPKRRKRTLTTDEIRQGAKVREWILARRGVLAEVAVYCNVSHQYAQQVAYGTSTSRPGNKVERRLLDLGWPGIRRSRV